jgi:hypothetical protein
LRGKNVIMLTAEEIKSLLALGEGYNVEFKRAVMQ